MADDLWAAITLAEKEGRLNQLLFQQSEPLRIYWAPDLHVPFHNQDAVTYCLDVARGADIIGQIGDGNDAYGISSFNRDPQRASCLQAEADAYQAVWLKPVRKMNPTARIIQLLGNHENRLTKYLWKKAPELAGMRSLTWNRIWNLPKYNIELHPHTGLYLAGHRVKHGERVNAHAGGSARLEMEDHRCDGVSGHTHRYGVARRTDKEGIKTEWYEIGHACDETQVAAEYCPTPNWNLSGGLEIIYHPTGKVEYKEHRLS